MKLFEALKELQEGNKEDFEHYISEKSKEVTRRLVNGQDIDSVFEDDHEDEAGTPRKTTDKQKTGDGHTDQYEDEYGDDDHDAEEDDEDVEEKKHKKEYKKDKKKEYKK